MATTSIHIKPCIIGSSEAHNQRLKHLDYVRSDLSPLNEQWVGVANLSDHLRDLKDLVKEKTGRKMQAKATPIREGVIVIDSDTTLKDLKVFSERLEERWGITTLQIYTHKDEGHMDTNGAWKTNLHAHMVFDWVDHATGKSIKLSKQDMAEMQTMLATCLSMQRGESSDLKHLSSVQYKNKMEVERLKTLKREAEQTEQIEQAASMEIIEQNTSKSIFGSRVDYKEAFKASEERRERISAQLMSRDSLMEEFGLKSPFKSFWEDCKRWFGDVSEIVKDLALMIWRDPKGINSGGTQYTADKRKGRLLVDGHTIEQALIQVPSSDIQKRAERITMQKRANGGTRKQETAQDVREQRGRKL